LYHDYSEYADFVADKTEFLSRKDETENVFQILLVVLPW